MDTSKVVFLNNYKRPIEFSPYEKQEDEPFRPRLSLLLGPLKRQFTSTIPSIGARIPELFLNGEYVEALELSASGLRKCRRNSERHSFWWWVFMSYAAYCASCLNHTKIMNLLISMSEGGHKPVAGRNAAYCYCRFSHFKYVQQEYDSAIQFAELARKLDDGSGEAHYLLGYYELFINEKDPTEFFNAAIERDRRMLRRILRHPSLNEYPEILSELTKLQAV